MKTAVVNFKTTPEVKKRAMEKTQKAGIPLSFLLNQRLNEIASGKKLIVDFDEEPSEMLKQDLRESEEDRKAGRTSPVFDNIEDSIAWLNDPNAKYENQV
ncbi:MAG: hypothetical protein QF747_01610 [Patescibacteria group bacterium]|jgi:antitoxin component of RelBE/YafQ-DinJ toxin-antitoxin module|nr:hypothetical protein [Patescibacteria group bacterium]